MSDGANDNTQLPQETIYEAVVARGYANGYEPDEFAARQLLKMLEELSEAMQHVFVPTHAAGNIRINTNAQQDAFEDMRDQLNSIAASARVLFDAGIKPHIWQSSDINGELVDIAVTMFVAAQARGFDLVAKAVEKAERDIARGVRKS